MNLLRLCVCCLVPTLVVGIPWLTYAACPQTTTNTSKCSGSHLECIGQLTNAQCPDVNFRQLGVEVLNGNFSCKSSTLNTECIDDTFMEHCTRIAGCGWNITTGKREPKAGGVYSTHVRKYSASCPTGG